MMRRELVSSGEVTDVLLDVRTLLTLPALAAADARSEHRLQSQAAVRRRTGR